MDYDLCVIGGGVNGAGIARDAAGRGYKVLLVEAQDLAGATSSASTKLVHGGLRYLEQYDFKLVKESLEERETLLNAAPHIIWPLRFILPHHSALRPVWLIRLGLFFYDRLAGRQKLKKSQSVDFNISPVGDPLKDNYKTGFEYADCWVEDSRLVVLNAMDAKERGADVLTQTACVFAEKEDFDEDQKGWRLHLKEMQSDSHFQVTAKMIVNSAGPWTRQFLENSNLVAENDNTPNLRLVQGSHIVTHKLYEGDHPYLLQQVDGRIVFTIPYEQNFTLIGTTDTTFEGDAAQAVITEEEIDYLLHAVNDSFKKQISRDDIIWTYSGVRALVDDGKESSSKVTRDYKLLLNEHEGAPILSVFGGKITTYRVLAEESLAKINLTFVAHKYKEKTKPWTSGVPLPGGDIPNGDFDLYVERQQKRYSFLPNVMIYRYARAYGTRMDEIIDTAKKTEDLGRNFGDHIYEAEINYLIEHEFAKTIDDILWRRSKLGLHIAQNTAMAIEAALPELMEEIKGSSFKQKKAVS